MHCPTNGMVADFHTKLLQGQKFVKFRNVIMNFDDDLKDKFGHLQQQLFYFFIYFCSKTQGLMVVINSPQECVGKHANCYRLHL